LLEEEFHKLDSHVLCEECFYRDSLRFLLGGRSAAEYLIRAGKDVLEGKATAETLRKLIHLTLLTIHSNLQQYEMKLEERSTV